MGNREVKSCRIRVLEMVGCQELRGKLQTPVDVMRVS